jgi:hypothetical protein
MKKLLVSTVAASLLMATAPAFATSPSEEVQQDPSTSLSCRVVLHEVTLPDGSIGFHEEQVCA